MKKPLQILFLFLLALIQGTNMQAQNNPNIKRTMHWYFGEGAGLDFTSGTPVADTLGKVNSDEASFTMSDTCGNLLVYGYDSIFSKTHTFIESLDFCTACNPKQMLCIPQPGNDSIFYIFYMDYWDYGIYYAIFNRNMNGGTGGIISKDNYIMGTPTDQPTEMLAATYHCNDLDIWIVGKKASDKNLYAWLLTSTGFITTPVVSTVTPTLDFNNGCFANFSPDGSMMASMLLFDSYIPYPDSSYILLNQFDNCTGIFYNPIKIPFSCPISTAFSQDNSKLYIVTDFECPFNGTVNASYLMQYDVSVYDSASILSSKKIIFQSTDTFFFGLQLGPDGKIYVVDFDTFTTSYYYTLTHAGMIDSPNNSGVACNYIPDAIDLMGRVHFGFPEFVDSYFRDLNYFNCSTDIEEIKSQDSIVTIYPNPASDFINIQCRSSGNNKSDSYRIKIYNTTGILCIEKNITDENTVLDIHSLSSGLYFMQFFQNNNHLIINFKIVIL